MPGTHMVTRIKSFWIRTADPEEGRKEKGYEVYHQRSGRTDAAETLRQYSHSSHLYQTLSCRQQFDQYTCSLNLLLHWEFEKVARDEVRGGSP